MRRKTRLQYEGYIEAAQNVYNFFPESGDKKVTLLHIGSKMLSSEAIFAKFSAFLLCSLHWPATCQGRWQPSKYMLILGEPLIKRELVSGRSWTSKVFNTVITLDNYQFP
jgi:hypothetical protein